MSPNVEYSGLQRVRRPSIVDSRFPKPLCALTERLVPGDADIFQQRIIQLAQFPEDSALTAALDPHAQGDEPADCWTSGNIVLIAGQIIRELRYGSLRRP